MGIGKNHTLVRQRVDICRLEVWATHKSEIVGPGIIEHDDQHIGTFIVMVLHAAVGQDKCRLRTTEQQSKSLVHGIKVYVRNSFRILE